MIVLEPAEIQRYAEEILRRPEFHTTMEEPRVPGGLQRALEWLVLHRVLSLGNVSIGTVLLIAVGAALAIFLALRLVRLFRSGAFLRGRTEKPSAGQRVSAPAPSATTKDSLRLAGMALAAGDARSAIQALLRACLNHLADRGAITLERWKTNTIYLDECSTSLPSFAVFRDLAMAHNDIVYAHRGIETKRIGAMRDALVRQIEVT